MGKATQSVVEFNKIKPKTRNQTSFVKSIQDNDITICSGPAGSGKTLIAIGIACQYLLEAKIEKILITRTIITAGHELGAFKGDLNEKIYPYFSAQAEYLYQILGSSYRKYLDKQILLRPLEILRGHSYHNTIIILDEASNCDTFQIKLFLSRMGNNSKAIIIGDLYQKDINANGLNFCINHLNNVENCQVVSLNYEDILRNKNLAKILEVFDKNGF